jgi:hypothetical protein
LMIITHWSMITGRDLKATRVGVGLSAPPTRTPSYGPMTVSVPPAPATSVSVNGNGRAPAENVG